MTRSPIDVSSEVHEAVAGRRPVVALESTIFTHGLPRPHNVEVAAAAEEQLRAVGVTPATVGVVAGKPTVGLTGDQIERLSSADDVVKVSTRDLPVAAMRGASGGTTVAATAFLAHGAGIRVFSTGGLGGVHRGASQTYDESADLLALASTPIVVVSAGVKSILDVGATLERLETLNIPVVGYRTREFPGFYTARSGFGVEYAVESAEEAAEMARWRDQLALSSAVLVANPIAEDAQLDPDLHDSILADALSTAERDGVTGHDTTPYLLDYMTKASDGKSLAVNIAIYRSNVRLGGEIAAALARS